MRVLAFAASLRKESINRKLIRNAADIAREKGATVDLADFHEFDMPLYDGDVDAKFGLPEGALEFKRRIEAADALLISIPEYNHSLPGTLKNAIDWVSRAKPVPLAGKSAFFMSASPSPFGGLRGVMAARAPLETLKVFVSYDTFCLARANQAFDEQGKFIDPQNTKVLGEMLESFLTRARDLKEALKLAG